MIKKNKLTKCELINRILIFKPEYPKYRLWSYYTRSELIKMYKKLREEKEENNATK